MALVPVTTQVTFFQAKEDPVNGDYICVHEGDSKWLENPGSTYIVHHRTEVSYTIDTERHLAAQAKHYDDAISKVQADAALKVGELARRKAELLALSFTPAATASKEVFSDVPF